MTNQQKYIIIKKSLYSIYRGIVQLVEHGTPNPGVVGSSPAAPAIRKLSIIKLLWCFLFYLYNIKFSCFMKKKVVYYISDCPCSEMGP